ncbi:retinol dehydrogenase 8 [Seiridium cupressi]
MTAPLKTTKPLTWLITGCSSGFGLQFTRHALAAGQHVIATSRTYTRTPDLVADVEAAGGRWIALDVDSSSSGQVLTDLEESGTHIDVLVNSAGIGMAGPVENFSEDEIRGLMETNFFGPYRLMRAIVPYMRRRRSGVVVNLSTGSGLEARESLGGYGASKSALDGITKTLAREVAPFNVRVLLVYMGSFNTPMATKVSLAQKPLDPDYKGTMLDKYYEVFRSGTMKANGDHKKAVKAIYEVTVGEGIGVGREKEVQLVLGKDCAVRAVEVRDSLDHMMEVFGDVCNNVDIDEE